MAQPTLAKTSYTKGTPGTFQGKNYRKSAAENTNEMVKLLVLKEQLITGGTTSKDIVVVGEGVKKEVAEIDEKIKQLELDGGNIKKANREFQKTNPL